jgi:N-acetylglucosaminylphosphatidylinositol deacetylase
LEVRNNIAIAYTGAVMMQWVTALAVPLAIGVCWFYTLFVQRNVFPKLRNKRICFLIAHPDDEAMFFAPTILALTEPLLGNHVKVLCMSSGTSLSVVGF